MLALAQNLRMADDGKDPYKVLCGERLASARRAVGYSSRRAFARLTLAGDTSESEVKRAADRLDRWEIGEISIPASYVDKLRSMFGITPDYVFSGDLSSTPSDLRAKIVAQDQDND